MARVDTSPLAPPEYVNEAMRLRERAGPRLSEATRNLIGLAQTEARQLDDNHVGTEHIVLGLYALEESSAVSALLDCGITREVFLGQLHFEEGPSPAGPIPMTVRATMIVGLAGSEAETLGVRDVEPEHVLLGAIRESGKWESLRKAGPYHLRQAAEAAGTSLSALETNVIRRIRATDGGA